MKTFFVSLLLLFASISLYAQRMHPKDKGLEVSYGIYANALHHPTQTLPYFLAVGYTCNGQKGNYQHYGLAYHKQYHTYKNSQIPTETFLAQAGYSFLWLTDRSKTIALHTQLAGLLGYEHFAQGKTQLYDGAVIQNSDALVYGVATALRVEGFVSDRWIVFLQANANLLLGTSLQRLRPYIGIGVRYTL